MVPATDKFAPIRDVFNTFTFMCQYKYTCNFSLMVDKQLMPLKSGCSFITFMPNKPDKYGITFWVLVDVKSKYVANITPYLGAQEKKQRANVPLGESVVVKLTEHINSKDITPVAITFLHHHHWLRNYNKQNSPWSAP